MWFRPGGSSSTGGEDRFRVSSFRSRIRGRKPSSSTTTATPTDTTATESSLKLLSNGAQKESSQQSLSSSDAATTTTMDTSTTSAGTGTESLSSSSLSTGGGHNDSIEIPHDNKVTAGGGGGSGDKSAAPVVVAVVPLEEEGDHELEEKRIKDQVILTGPKFKSNRIEKSSSRTRVVPLSSRKISAPPVMDSSGGPVNGGGGGAPTTVKKNPRSHSSLNLNSLLKYKSLLYTGSSAEKKLTPEDFDKMRKKSISEVAKAAQPNSDATSSVKLIRHEFIDEVDDANIAGEAAAAVVVTVSADISRRGAKMSLSDKVAAKLSDSKKKRSKSKTRKRRSCRRSSCNNSAVNIPTVIATKLEKEDKAEDEEEEEGNTHEEEEDDFVFSLGRWSFSDLRFK